MKALILNGMLEHQLHLLSLQDVLENEIMHADHKSPIFR
jgi:hypothetical protein